MACIVETDVDIVYRPLEPNTPIHSHCDSVGAVLYGRDSGQ